MRDLHDVSELRFIKMNIKPPGNFQFFLTQLVQWSFLAPNVWISTLTDTKA